MLDGYGLTITREGDFVIYRTQRLLVEEVHASTLLPLRDKLLSCIPEILTPTVVDKLPDYFQQVTSSQNAAIWLQRMLADSRLFMVEVSKGKVIGFLFVFESSDDVQIGYLLAEEYWGQGLASELLQGFILYAQENEAWSMLVGGVDKSNIASAKLLEKLGFTPRNGEDQQTIYYQYPLKPR